MVSSLDALKEQLLSRSGRGATYGLERMQRALSVLGHPERGLPVVHVAGTNGKGSVCAMVEAIALSAGLRTGMFTSPHLCSLNERIRIDGAPIDDPSFAAALSPALQTPVTFFETMTLSAMRAMHDAAVDIAIFEVGLGGRLDATNVLADKRCTAIVSIAHDHTRLLGDTDRLIAIEKAGIVKQGTPLVLGPVSDEARDAIVSVARDRQAAPVWMVADDSVDGRIDIEPRGDSLDITTPAGTVEGAQVGLAGAHQRDNAAVACAVAMQLGIDTGAIADGLAQTTWPGRLESIRHQQVTVLLDCAHNEHAARALADATTTLDPARTRLIFGAMGDKAWGRMLRLVGPRAHTRYYCEPLPSLVGRKPAPPPQLAALLPGAVMPSPEAALTRALA